MTDRLAIALAQLNPTVGGIEGNVDCILKAREQARALGADLMLASELVVCGYPPEDLVLKPAFIDAVLAGIQTLAQATSDGGTAILVGSPWRDQGKVMNSALLLDQGRIASVRYKHDLPNYGVFDEKRLFAPGPLPGPMPFRGVRLGVMVCEDMWTPDAAECLQESGAELLLVPNGSPYEFEKRDQRIQLAIARVTETG
jgi:NAD+ synthase